MRTSMGFMFAFVCILLHSHLSPRSVQAQNTWEALEGPTAISVRFMTVTSEGSLLALQHGGGVLRSTDEGRSWTRTLRERHAGWRQEILRVGTMLYLDMAGTLMHSSDDGQSWDSLPGPENLRLLTVTPQGHLLAAVDSLIYRSTDLGQHWVECTPGNIADGGKNARAAADNAGNLFLAYNGIGVLRSSDDGISWNNVLRIDEHYSMIGVFFADSDILMVEDTHDTLYLSTDAGSSWSATDIPGSYLEQVYRLPDHALLMTMRGSFYRSTDNGTSWSTISTSKTLTIDALAILDEHRFICTEENRIVRSDDGAASWQDVALTGLAYCGGYMDLRRSADSILFCWTGSELHHFSIENDTWSRPTYPDSLSAASELFRAHDGTLWSIARRVNYKDPFRIIRSFDGGRTWERRGQFFHEHFTRMYEYTPFAQSVDGLLLFDRDGVIMRSSDGGVTWQEFGTWDESLDGGYVKSVIGLQPPHAHIMLAATGAKGLKRSIDGGATWQPVDPGGSSSQPYCLHVFETHDADVFLVTWDEIFRSTDQGATWELMTMTVFPEHIGTVLTDTYDHLYEYQPERNTPDALWLVESTDRGEHWRHVTLPPLPVPTNEVVSIAFDGRNRLIITTWFDGLFRLDASLTGVETPSVLPEQPGIIAVYPQPFVATASSFMTVRIALPALSAVDLSILDLMGRKQLGLETVDLVPGEHDLRINSTSLAPGAYLLLLRAGSQTAVRMLSVLR